MGVRAYVYGRAAGDADDIEIAFLEYEVPGGAMISDPEVIKWVSVERKWRQVTSIMRSALHRTGLYRKSLSTVLIKIFCPVLEKK